MPLTNRQYDEIMHTYELKQTRRRELIESRAKKISELSPEYGRIDAEVASLGVSCAKALLSGDEKTAQKLKGEISLLSEKRGKIVKELGFSSDYLDPPYACPACRDTGYADGTRCSCFIQASIDLMYRQSELGGADAGEKFSDFSLDYYSEDICDSGTGISSYEAAKRAYDTCRDFVKGFDSRNENIFLFGDTGVGKTFLAGCTAGELLDSGHSVVYFSAQRLFELLAREAFGKSEDNAAVTENILGCDLLIIDDLGTEMPNSFTASRLFLCLNERIRKNKSIFISSNLQLRDIASVYSERIFSRISDSFILLHLFGNDIRIQKKLGASMTDG